jgi:hypothetical protein
MFLQNLMDTTSSNMFYVLGGLILIIYVITSRRRLKKLQDKIPDSPRGETERDVLGMEKEIPQGIEHFTSLDKVMKWKVVLLVVLMIIGLYLVVFQGPTINNDTGPVESYIEQGPID